MGAAARTSGRRHAAATLAAIGAAAGLILSACAISGPVVQTTAEAPTPTVVQVEPTAIPAPPTPQPPPTAEPTTPPEPDPTAAPEPTPRSQNGPAPLPTAIAGDDGFESTPVGPGLVAIPIAQTTFRLNEARPILQLGGHTLIYVDDEQLAEVDIFTPVAFPDGSLVASYGSVIDFLTTDALFEIEERNPVTISGHPTRVFEGRGNGVTGTEFTRAFITDANQLDNEELGWVPPDRLRLWVIDHPDGTIIVSAEGLDLGAQYSEALRLASEILSTIEFS